MEHLVHTGHCSRHWDRLVNKVDKVSQMTYTTWNIGGKQTNHKTNFNSDKYYENDTCLNDGE